MTNTAHTLRKVTADQFQHHVTDTRKATKFEVLVDGVVVGTVYSRSEESWAFNRSGTLRTRRLGLKRYWVAVAADANGNGKTLTRYASTRKVALNELFA